MAILPTNYTGTGSGFANDLGGFVNNPVGTVSGYLGQQVPTNPGGASGINQQSGLDSMQQMALMRQRNQLFHQQQQTYAGQNALAGNLNNTINNVGAPSVAMSQLGSGLNQIGGQQLSMAAGANGENAFAANRAAMQNTAGASAGLNAEQAGLRAQEVASAQNNLGNLYGTQLGAQNTTMGQDVNANTSLAGTTMTGQGEINTTNSAAQLANAKANSSLLGSLGSGLASLGGMM